MILFLAFYVESTSQQIMIMNLSNYVVVIYHGISQPFLTSKSRKLDLINELFVGIFSQFMFIYSDLSLEPEAKYSIAWV